MSIRKVRIKVKSAVDILIAQLHGKVDTKADTNRVLYINAKDAYINLWPLKYCEQEFDAQVDHRQEGFLVDGLDRMLFKYTWVDIIYPEIELLAKMPKNTRLYVSDANKVPTSKDFHRYFARVVDDKVYCYASGATAWSRDHDSSACTLKWKYWTIGPTEDKI